MVGIYFWHTEQLLPKLPYPPRNAMTVTHNRAEILSRANQFAKEFADARYEMGEAQNFIRGLCDVFGFSSKRPVSFEHRVKKLDGRRGRIDGFYPGKLLIENRCGDGATWRAGLHRRDRGHGTTRSDSVGVHPIRKQRASRVAIGLDRRGARHSWPFWWRPTLIILVNPMWRRGLANRCRLRIEKITQAV